MLAHGLIENRLRYQGSIRQRSIMHMANKYQINLEQSERTVAFALNFFDQTQGILHNWETEERQLLWTAAILHNCGLYVSHSAHHKHSYYLIRNGELLGYTEIEIEVIANLARYHRKNPPKKKHDNFVILPKKYREVVSKLHPFLRLAVALDRWQIGAISDFKCEHRPEVREFHINSASIVGRKIQSTVNTQLSFSFSTPPSTVNSQQSTIIPVQPELISFAAATAQCLRRLHSGTLEFGL
jgi:exopolyphosphatase/guanosine-5'-triphosphate,3'-diphosphate pyrophosphatase